MISTSHLAILQQNLTFLQKDNSKSIHVTCLNVLYNITQYRSSLRFKTIFNYPVHCQSFIFVRKKNSTDSIIMQYSETSLSGYCA